MSAITPDRMWHLDGGIWAEVAAERQRAHIKHGNTSMESEPADDPTRRRFRILIEEVGEVAKEFNDAEHELRTVDLEFLRRELIQVAAMAGAWADAIPQNPHQEGGTTDDASRLGVRGATWRQESTAGGDTLKVAPVASEVPPAAEEGTSGRATRPASTSCSQCGQRTPLCADCGDSIIFVPKSGFGQQGEWQHVPPRNHTIAPHMPRPKVFVT